MEDKLTRDHIREAIESLKKPVPQQFWITEDLARNWLEVLGYPCPGACVILEPCKHSQSLTPRTRYKPLS